MLKTVEVTANITYNDIINAKDAILKFITTETDITRLELLINILFTQPFTRVKHLEDAYAENIARKYLDQLDSMQIVEKRMISGSAYYLNLELYRILSE